MGALSRVLAVPRKYPVVRGMAAYAILWPVSSIIQQTFEHSTQPEPIDWARALRFGLFGSCFVAPTMYMWIRFSGRKWPGKDLTTAVKRAFMEQLTYGPCAMVSFYFCMSAMEMRPIQECIDEVRLKAWPTLKVGVCVWPVVQTFNTYFIAEKNRVVVVSVVSLLWTCFLAHMKSLDKQDLEI